MSDFVVGDNVRIKVGALAGCAGVVKEYFPNSSYKEYDVTLSEGTERGLDRGYDGRELMLISPESEQVMPVDSAARKNVPITSGVFDYFPAALAEIARVSKAGNDKHNPGEPLHWARGKSTDQADAIGRHLIDRGGIDPDTGMRHSAELAWRALAMLQLELEEAGAPVARGASIE